MFKQILTRRDPRAPRSTRRIELRSGPRVRHCPEPMPRIRWYS